MKKTIAMALATTLLLSGSAFAQVAVGVGTDAGVQIQTPVIDAATGASVDVAASSNAIANSYSALTATVAASANAATDVSAVNDQSKVSIVLVSSLQGDLATEGTALNDALTTNADSQATLQASVEANAAIKASLDAGGYDVDDVVAVVAQVDGSATVFVDDRA